MKKGTKIKYAVAGIIIVAAIVLTTVLIPTSTVNKINKGESSGKGAGTGVKETESVTTGTVVDGTKKTTGGESDGERKAGEEWIDETSGVTFVWIPAGEFMMGSPTAETGRYSNEGTSPRKVRITNYRQRRNGNTPAERRRRAQFIPAG